MRWDETSSTSNAYQQFAASFPQSYAKLQQIPTAAHDEASAAAESPVDNSVEEEERISCEDLSTAAWSRSFVSRHSSWCRLGFVSVALHFSSAVGRHRRRRRRCHWGGPSEEKKKYLCCCSAHSWGNSVEVASAKPRRQGNRRAMLLLRCVALRCAEAIDRRISDANDVKGGDGRRRERSVATETTTTVAARTVLSTCLFVYSLRRDSSLSSIMDWKKRRLLRLLLLLNSRIRRKGQKSFHLLYPPPLPNFLQY